MRFPMPFQDQERRREELCCLAMAEGSNRRELGRRFNVQPRILYKRLERYRTLGAAGLADRSRRPHRPPARTDRLVEAAVLAIRRDNPVWGGRKIAASLRRQGVEVPAPSTITEILHRHGEVMMAAGRKVWKRFEHAEPNVM